MSEKIERTLKKLADATSKASSTASSSPSQQEPSLGNPDCPHCGGLGYLRTDVPPDHPDFGRLEICTCRQAEIHERIRQRLYSLSRLEELQHLTFDSFEPRGRVGYGKIEQASIENAYNLAKLFAENRNRWLLLQGGYGCGKTHLAAAIANHCAALGIPTLFLTVPDLLDSLRFAYSAEDVTFEERFDRIRNAPLLILDDFGTQHATEWAREKLFQILNYRYINRLPTVITTNLALGHIEARMKSRLLDETLVDIVQIRAPDYRRAKDSTGQHALSSLDTHDKQTFGTFSTREGEKLPPMHVRSLEEAFESARKFSEDPTGWIVFQGGYGCGKTHLAAAIANYRASEGHQVMFVMVPDLLDHLRATFNPSSQIPYDRLFEEVRTAPLLVLDDLGSQATTPWVREKLYQLFDYRYNEQMPTVITTADKEDQIDPRLLSRMQDRRLCLIVPITAPAFRGQPRKRRKSRR
jgi:DNA replication protein DnaC